MRDAKKLTVGAPREVTLEERQGLLVAVSKLADQEKLTSEDVRRIRDSLRDERQP